MEENFPGKELLPVTDFIKEGLNVQTANKTKIDFDGVVLLNFKLCGNEEDFDVPVLVSSKTITESILGYNVIEYLILKGSLEQRKALGSSLRCTESAMESLVAVITDKAESDPDFLTEIKTTNTVRIPAGHKTQIRCRIK